jgi:hypothetical protein
VIQRPDAPVSFVDDPVPACSRPRIDAYDLHMDTLGAAPDVPARIEASRFAVFKA